MLYAVIAVITAATLCLLLNALRYIGDAALGTNAHILLSNWDSFLGKLQIEDIRAAGIAGSSLPLRVSRESFNKLPRFRGSMPNLEDPWGFPVLIELLSESPKLRWRVTLHIGRSFFGRWGDASREVESQPPSTPWHQPDKERGQEST
jgi:hypothetical protein